MKKSYLFLLITKKALSLRHEKNLSYNSDNLRLDIDIMRVICARRIRWHRRNFREQRQRDPTNNRSRDISFQENYIQHLPQWRKGEERQPAESLLHLWNSHLCPHRRRLSSSRDRAQWRRERHRLVARENHILRQQNHRYILLLRIFPCHRRQSQERDHSPSGHRNVCTPH